MFTFNHFNFNVLDLARSVQFYHDALGLEPVRTKDASDGSFPLVFLGDGHSPFQLELTWLRDRTQPYDLGEGVSPRVHRAGYGCRARKARGHGLHLL